ncbi:MAG: hypothetical protein H8E55_29300, partial [Pelagibacterales bacterium]|nr:hypothetical protein [Pelagibacterales bacterium]
MKRTIQELIIALALMTGLYLMFGIYYSEKPTQEKGYWTISYDGIDPDQDSLDHISDLIQKGFTEGEITQEV